MLDSLLLSASQKDFLNLASAAYEKNVDDLGPYLEGRGIDRDAAIAAHLGLVSDPMPGHERFVGMMSIPYVTPAGVMAIKFRNLDPEAHQKYDGPAGQHARLYGVMALHGRGDVIAVCEGEMDTIMCNFMVGVPAVGSPGTNWLPHWPRCLADYERVLVIADNDLKEDDSNPGMKHAKKVQSTIPNSIIITPPEGMDLSDWVLAHGVEAVREALS